MKKQCEALLDEVGTSEQKSTYHARLEQMAFLQNRFRTPAENVDVGQTALAFAEESGNALLIARGQFHLGFQLLWRGDLKNAEKVLQKAAALAEALGDAWLHNQNLTYLIILYRLQGKVDRVAALLPNQEEISRRLQYDNYIGVNRANSAWLHYHAGKWMHARSQAETALASWSATKYPMQWLAHWILLAMALLEERHDDSASSALALLDINQQQLPDEIDDALAAAVSAWEAGEETTARAFLETAVELAEQHGYL